MDTSASRLVDRMEESELIVGQLLTPLTKFANWGGVFAVDNGAYSAFHERRFISLLRRNEDNVSRCLFVTVTDIVGSHARTLDLWRFRRRWVSSIWPLAFVAQDGAEAGYIPWDDIAAIFIGGLDPWKDSKSAVDIVKTAKILGKHSHVGRVNSLDRYKRFRDAGADTCDGSGISRFSHMLEKIEKGNL